MWTHDKTQSVYRYKDGIYVLFDIDNTLRDDEITYRKPSSFADSSHLVNFEFAADIIWKCLFVNEQVSMLVYRCNIDTAIRVLEYAEDIHRRAQNKAEE